MALASAPRPDQPYKINFGYDEIETAFAICLYNRDYVDDSLKSRDISQYISHLTFSDALHIILAVFQNQPLSLELYAMKRLLADDVELRELPEGLKLKVEKVDSIR